MSIFAIVTVCGNMWEVKQLWVSSEVLGPCSKVTLGQGGHLPDLAELGNRLAELGQRWPNLAQVRSNLVDSGQFVAQIGVNKSMLVGVPPRNNDRP